MVIRYERDIRLLAAALSSVAGCVDAIGFLMTGGFFISFMSGNSTRMALGVAEGAAYAAFAFGLIATFVAGAALGAVIGRIVGGWRAVTVLSFVTVLLAAAAALAAAGHAPLAIFPLVLAMGAENTVFSEAGEVKVGLTYMTGTLVKLGKRIAGAMMGDDRMAWAPYLLLWMGLVAGTVVGALAYAAWGTQALWLPAGAMAILAVAAGRFNFAAPERA